MRQLLGLSLIAACACSAPAPKATSEAKAQASATGIVRIGDLSGWTKASALDAVIADFNAHHKAQGLSAKSVFLEDPAYRRSELEGLRAAPPDVLLSLAGHKLEPLVKAELLRALDALWADKTRALKSTANSVRFGERYYALPYAYDGQGLYYDTALFSRLKLKPPKRWADLLRLCDRLRDQGITPIAAGNKEAWATGYLFDALILAEGGYDTLLALKRGRLPYTDSKVTAALSKWSQLLKAGCLSKKASQQTIEQAVQQLKAGEAAILVVDAAYIPDKLRGALSFAPFPSSDPERAIYGPTHPVESRVLAAAIPSGAKNPEGAAAFLAFLAKPEVQVKLSAGSKLLFPARADAPPKDPLLRDTQAVLSKDPAVRVRMSTVGIEDNDMLRESREALKLFTMNPARQQAIQARLEALRQRRLARDKARERYSRSGDHRKSEKATQEYGRLNDFQQHKPRHWKKP